jgi:primosomal protein N' (replication factor Y)
MPHFCDVALPVPLDRVFTYRVNGFADLANQTPAVGCRVIVPFRNEKLTGIVTRVHDEPPPVEAKAIIDVLDAAPLLAPDLMELAAWISQYYLAPLGEVFRSMLPLMAEVKHQTLYRIAEKGREALYASASEGSSRRSRKSAADQDIEYNILNYLNALDDGEAARIARLRSATGATLDLLNGMLRKKWIARETSAVQRDARRTDRFAVLIHDVRIPKLNANQQMLLAELAGAGGEFALAELRRLDLPDSTLGTLVRRGLVRIEERPADFHLSSLSTVGNAIAYTLNPAQQAALFAITTAMGAGEFRPTLLHGVTGSGKTAVYLAAMQSALDAGYSAILLVPEIGLTPAIAAQLYTAFGSHVALLHSALTPEERAEQWHRIRTGDARVVVGTRSAVFAPVSKLGLIIVDEEHDASYKQEENPRYHARDVAVMRAKLNSAAVMLGSATPSLESWRNATTGKYELIELRQRVADRPLPVVELVDMRKEFQETGQEQLFSRQLIEETRATLDRGEQAIILLNRRGYSFVVLCRACGEKLQCENCAISLTYHRPIADDQDPSPTGQRLQCHYCGYKRTVPKICPACESEQLHFLGAGSQQGEQRLQEIFPHARIGRMDRDTVRGRHDMERLLIRLHSGDINLLVGTQMIAKGHDLHGVTLVGVVGADFALGLPNFRAAERVFQLLTQVSGRAGRGELPGRVLVQTYHSDHYAIRFAAAHDFQAFAEKELHFRRWMHYPPFAALANLIVQSPRLEEAAAWSTALGKWFQNTPFDGVRILGPATAPISRLKRIYRFHFVIKAAKRATLARTLRAALAHADTLKIPQRNLIVDVDAVNLM